MITSKPSQPQTVIATMQYSAWSGSWKNPCDGDPELVQEALTSPKFGSSSQMKMIAVATVEITTGMNTPCGRG